MATNMDQDIQTILVTETELDRVTFRIASEIDRDYKDAEHLVLLCILKGSIVFTGELMRK
jgi:hypoxanthine-guanine phosphoribosyltransferase